MTLPGSGPAPSLPLDAATMSRWGLAYAAADARLRVAPALVPGEREAVVGPFRAGRSVVALRLRCTPSTVALQVSLSFGPPIRVEACLADPAWAVPAGVDEVALGSHRAAFEASAIHEIIWRR